MLDNGVQWSDLGNRSSTNSPKQTTTKNYSPWSWSDAKPKAKPPPKTPPPPPTEEDEELDLTPNIYKLLKQLQTIHTPETPIFKIEIISSLARYYETKGRLTKKQCDLAWKLLKLHQSKLNFHL